MTRCNRYTAAPGSPASLAPTARRTMTRCNSYTAAPGSPANRIAAKQAYTWGRWGRRDVATPPGESKLRQLPDAAHHLGHDLQVKQELLGGLELVVVVTGVFDVRHGQAELHAVGQFVHRGGAGGGAELVLHAEVFAGHGEQGLDPFTLGIAVHRLGNGEVEGRYNVAVLAPGIQFRGDFGFQYLRGFALRYSQVDCKLEGFVIHPDISQGGGERAHELIGETHCQFTPQVIQPPVVGGVAGGVGDVVVLERDLAVEAVDEVQHPRHRVDAGLGFGGVGGHTSDG